MATFFGAIADDFTGATDLAALLARSGVCVSLRLGVPDSAPYETSPVEIIALKCRTSPVDDAIAETQRALSWLRWAGAQRFFWKYCSTFDSTPRGNIGPVAQSLMKSLGVTQTIYCPAFPENGRAIFMGNLFVGEVPLAESPMKDHPLTPMRDSNLMRLLAPQVTSPVGLANRHTVAKGAAALRARLAEQHHAGVAHVVVDAVANDDLAIIAEACHDMTLMTGGSAVAMPLPNIWLREGLLSHEGAAQSHRAKAGPAIILSGSCSAMTNQQVEYYLGAGHPSFQINPLDLAANGANALLDWLAKQGLSNTPLIYATTSPEEVRRAQEKLGTQQAGALVEATLAICATKAHDLGFRSFVVAGGETSGAVAKALGITQLDVGSEIAPGVPWCFAQTMGHEVAITLKSGNFGSKTFFSDALAALAR